MLVMVHEDITNLTDSRSSHSVIESRLEVDEGLGGRKEVEEGLGEPPEGRRVK